MTSRFGVLALVAACAGLLLSGCGFQPLYGSAGYGALPGLQINTSDSRQDYLIEQALDRFLGAGRSPYRLTLETEAVERRLGVSAVDQAARFAITLTTQYRLTDGEGERLTGELAETVFFDAPDDPYALITARADAEERAADLIAQSLARRIAAALERRRTQGGP